jgi:hypothetical protein
MTLPKSARDALPNQVEPTASMNISQINGTTASTDNGASDGGTLRVTIASNSTGQVTLATGNVIVGNSGLSVGFGAQGAGMLPLYATHDGGGNAQNAADFFGSGAVNSVGDQYITSEFFTRSDTFTVAASGTAVNISVHPFRDYSIQVTATGAVTSWDVRLEGSIDGVTYTQIVQHTNADGTGITKASANRFPAMFFRSRCAAIVLGGGTNVVVKILGIQ